MKVSVTLTEVLTYKITKEVEISSTDYATYIRTGKLPSNTETNLEHDLSSEVDDKHWVETEHYINYIEKA
jgi:hypothetical protein